MEKRKRLPYKALLRRDDPMRPSDAHEVEAAMLSIASGSECLSYAGSHGDELYCRVFRIRFRRERSRNANVDRCVWYREQAAARVATGPAAAQGRMSDESSEEGVGHGSEHSNSCGMPHLASACMHETGADLWRYRRS